ncbi:unnamed protein product [Tilletia caries]|nr:unnamed protein product [Tilletia caries]
MGLAIDPLLGGAGAEWMTRAA